MTENPLVSVVIPTCNRPRLVLRAVQSALRQSYRPLEIIVVVDGPDLASVESLRELRDERIKVVLLEGNLGGSEARNIGVRQSSGTWIAFLDDDDEWLPQKIEKQMRFVECLANKRAFVSCRFVERSGDQVRTYPIRLPDRNESIDDYMCRPRGIRAGGELLQTSTLLVPRSLMIDVPFVRGLKRGQEFIWLIEAGTRGGAAFHVLGEALSIFNADGFSDDARVSRKPNWRSFYKSLKDIRHLFRHRAYAYCIATRLLTDAIACEEPFQVKLSLLRDCMYSGGFMPKCVLTFLYIWMMPPATRRRIGEGLRIVRRLGGNPSQRAAEA
jgi:glycosyltransferase involved in cell wall biosynthesis